MTLELPIWAEKLFGFAYYMRWRFDMSKSEEKSIRHSIILGFYGTCTLNRHRWQWAMHFDVKTMAIISPEQLKKRQDKSACRSAHIISVSASCNAIHGCHYVGTTNRNNALNVISDHLPQLNDLLHCYQERLLCFATTFFGSLAEAVKLKHGHSSGAVQQTTESQPALISFVLVLKHRVHCHCSLFKVHF